MPKREIRAGWLDSERVAELAAGEDPEAGWLAEVMLLRLILAADDRGIVDAGPRMRAKLWPGGAPAVHEVEQALALLEAQGLVITYAAGGKPYLAIPRFRQRVRSKGKRPLPPAAALQAAEAPRKTAGKEKCRSHDRQMTVTPNAIKDRAPASGQVPAPTTRTGAARPSATRVRTPASPRPLRSGLDINKHLLFIRTTETCRTTVDNQPVSAMKTPTSESVDKPVDNPPDPESVAPHGSVRVTVTEGQDTAPEPERVTLSTAKPGQLPEGWRNTAQGIRRAGQALRIEKLPAESEDSYAGRIEALQVLLGM